MLISTVTKTRRGHGGIRDHDKYIHIYILAKVQIQSHGLPVGGRWAVTGVKGHPSYVDLELWHVTTKGRWILHLTYCTTQQ